MHPLDQLSKHFRLAPERAKALKRLRIETILDLLYHLPVRYEDISAIQSVDSLVIGQEAVVYGTIGKLKTRRAWKSRKPIAEGVIEDGSAKMKVIWFNQPYLAKMLREGSYAKLAGKVAGTAEKPYLANPEIETLEELPIDRHDSLFAGTEEIEETLFPVYRESAGVSSKWFYHALQKCFRGGVLDALSDPLPEAVRERYSLPELRTALVWVHAPKKETHTQAARKRFAFEEIFSIQIAKARERAESQDAASYQFDTDSDRIREFTDRLGFPLTGAQERAVSAILADFERGEPMSRLLEGDVGSGKTAVAAATAFAVATSRPDATKDWGNLQVAYMAPTEILARQHFLSFVELFRDLPVSIGLITGSGCMKFPSKVSAGEPTTISRAQLLKWVANGEIPILIGTHALVQKSVAFKHLAYVIIDEQHRFGTRQRRALAKKDERMPHLLSMTATPIPRTLALTVYGDLDLTVLDELPPGRRPVATSIVGPTDRKATYAAMRRELEAGRQAYVICPRIDEPDPDKLGTLVAKSVTEETARLAKGEFKGYELGTLHSRMTPKEKEQVMEHFAAGDIDVLVATSVVEVGVNVPNATVILIEGAERFGLAQLHQLRGRVIRSSHQAYCFCYTESTSERTITRLDALSSAKSGFELAELDLALRGSGELYGGRQWGITDLGMEAIKNPKMVEAAREEAKQLIEGDPDLAEHPALAARIATITDALHFE